MLEDKVNTEEDETNINPVSGIEYCEKCEDEEFNGWSSHCKECGQPLVY